MNAQTPIRASDLSHGADLAQAVNAFVTAVERGYLGEAVRSGLEQSAFYAGLRSALAAHKAERALIKRLAATGLPIADDLSGRAA